MKVLKGAQAVNHAMKYIRGLVCDGESYESAARKFSCNYPSETFEVLDMIGIWPSSERELRVLQRVAF